MIADRSGNERKAAFGLSAPGERTRRIWEYLEDGETLRTDISLTLENN